MRSSPIAVDKLTGEERQRLVAASAKARPSAAQRLEFRILAKRWREQRRMAKMVGSGAEARVRIEAL
jgi:hypothetical protein